MKWFKHLSGSIKDPFIINLVDNFGLEGYAIFFITLELMSDLIKNRDDLGTKVELKWNYIRTLIPKRIRFISKVLNFCVKENQFKIDFKDDGFSIYCDKLSKLSDNYSSKLRSNFQVTSKSLRSNFQVTSENSLTEVEVEEDSSSSTSTTTTVAKKNKKSSANKISNPAVKNLLLYYKNRYEQINGQKYVLNYARDGKTFSRLLKTFSEKEIQDRINWFLHYNEDFVIKAGHTIGVMVSQINKYKIPLKAQF